MLKVMVLLWVGALGTSLVGFVALVMIQSVAGLFRRGREDAHPVSAPKASPSPAVLAVRAEKAMQMPEPLAG